MSCQKDNERESYLEGLFDSVKPKFRYVAEMHAEDWVDSIFMEIVNGETEIATEQTPFESGGGEKYGFEDMLKKKLLADASL